MAENENENEPATALEWAQHAFDHLNQVERAVEHLLALAQSDDAAEPEPGAGSDSP